MKELESQVKSLERDNRRLGLHAESVEEKLALKDGNLLSIIEWIHSNEFELLKKSGTQDLFEEEMRRVSNAKYNKSMEEVRELIERVMIENISLKKNNR